MVTVIFTWRYLNKAEIPLLSANQIAEISHVVLKVIIIFVCLILVKVVAHIVNHVNQVQKLTEWELSIAPFVIKVLLFPH